MKRTIPTRSTFDLLVYGPAIRYQTLRLISTKFLPRRCIRVVVNRHLLHRNASRLHTTLLNIGRYWVPHWPHLCASHDSPHPCRRSLMPPKTARKRSLYSLWRPVKLPILQFNWPNAYSVKRNLLEYARAMLFRAVGLIVVERRGTVPPLPNLITPLRFAS